MLHGRVEGLAKHGAVPLETDLFRYFLCCVMKTRQTHGGGDSGGNSKRKKWCPQVGLNKPASLGGDHTGPSYKSRQCSCRACQCCSRNGWSPAVVKRIGSSDSSGRDRSAKRQTDPQVVVIRASHDPLHATSLYSINRGQSQHILRTCHTNTNTHARGHEDGPS